ncbi:MAG: hypothetical protein ACYTGV_20000 [Planctomycetota bacterium]|jgi:hypothetical protein
MTDHGQNLPWAQVDSRTGWYIPRRVVAAGSTRGVAPAYLQLVSGAGPYELEVLVRKADNPARLELVGQVSNASRWYDPVADLRLELVEADSSEAVADTRTNDFGEFDLITPGEACYGLRLGDAEDAPCVLVWGGAE